jgi:hypothetical protein
VGPMDTFLRVWTYAVTYTLLMKTPEYREGPEALDRFKQLATAILQAPAKKKKRQTKKSASLVKRSRLGLIWGALTGDPDVGWLE